MVEPRLNLPSSGYPRRWRLRFFAIGGMALACVIIALLVLTIGSVKIPFASVWSILVSHLPWVPAQGQWSANADMIITGIRLPRVVLSGLVGAALAVAGATYQGLFRNPLADPYLIGVAQGASLGAVLGFVFTWGILGNYLIPVLAFGGALIAVSVVYSVARVGKTLPVTTLILAGVAVGALLISITSYLTLISPDRTHGIISWLMGGFSTANWTQVGLVLPYIVVGMVVILAFARPLNVMQLDEDQAQQLGINVERTKLILLAASTLVTAAAVCFVGTIGFVGIIVPHAVRLVFGPDHRSLLPLSALAGACLLILADTVSRTLIPPQEIPVGVITAFLGAPFFVYLLRRKKKMVF
ncbi:MAG TPA: iron ABC transporter permease [Dehalococcoidales bacterium]|nr:iron ABC transporter permease [Dehalococcoidales bacterium]